MIFCLVAFLQFACSPSTGDSAAMAVESYIRALANQNKEELVNLSCKSWEEQAVLEVDALLSVGSEVKELSCIVSGEENGFTAVKCEGDLDLTYNDEVRIIELDRRTYFAMVEDGKWRVCSYK